MEPTVNSRHNLLRLLEKRDLNAAFMDEYLRGANPIDADRPPMLTFLTQYNNLLDAAMAFNHGDLNRSKKEIQACRMFEESIHVQVLKHQIAMKEEAPIEAKEHLGRYLEYSKLANMNIEAEVVQAYCLVKLNENSDYKGSLALLDQVEKKLEEPRQERPFLEARFLAVATFVQMRAPQNIEGQYYHREEYIKRADRYLDRLHEIISRDEVKQDPECEQYQLFYFLWKAEVLLRPLGDQTPESLERGYDLTRQALDLHDSKPVADEWILSRASKNLWNFIQQTKTGYLEPVINRANKCCDQQLEIIENSAPMMRITKVRLLWEVRVRELEDSEDIELFNDFRGCPFGLHRGADEVMERLKHGRNHYNRKETTPRLQNLMVQARDIAQSVIQDTMQRPFPDALNFYIRSKYAAEPDCAVEAIVEEAAEYMKNMTKAPIKGFIYRTFGLLFLSDGDVVKAKSMLQKSADCGHKPARTLLQSLN